MLARCVVGCVAASVAGIDCCPDSVVGILDSLGLARSPVALGYFGIGVDTLGSIAVVVVQIVAVDNCLYDYAVHLYFVLGLYVHSKSC